MNNNSKENMAPAFGRHPLILSRIESQKIDRLCIEEYRIPGVVLMENAGRGIVDHFLSLKPEGKVVICCGGGNNGGDGFVVARHLDNLGIPVQVVLFSEPDRLIGDAQVNYNIVMKSEIKLSFFSQDNLHTLKSCLDEATWIVDALFGTGLKNQVKSPYDAIIHTINSSNKNVLSIDIPSGLDCDTGEPLGIAVKASHTVTMVGLKKGFLNPKAKQYINDVRIVDIGAPRVLLNQFQRSAL